MPENNLLEVKTYNELIEKLKILGVTPKEAYSLAFKSRFNFDKRHFWTMYKITTYLRQRLYYAVDLKSKYDVEVEYPKKLWKLYYKELKEEKWHNEKILGGYAPNLKRMANYGFLKSLWYVDPAYWSDLINAVLENKEIIKLIKTKMPKRIATCRNVAESIMEFGYEDFFPGKKKADKYLEAINLHKLVTEKRHRHKFSPDYLDIRKAPNWNKIKWENSIWKKYSFEEFDKWHKQNLNLSKRMRKKMPDYAKSTYEWKDPKPDDMKYIPLKMWFLKHDWYGGKVNQFKHFTQRNINLVR